MNEKTAKCKRFAFALVAEHVQKGILKLNRITLQIEIIVMEYASSTRKRHTQKLQKNPKRPLAITNKHHKIRMYSALQVFLLE